MRTKISVLACWLTIAVASAQDAPPYAKPGHCYAKCLIKGGFTEWQEVLCGDKIRPQTLRKIQESLFAFGYYTGVVNGEMNAQTKSALSKFQKEKELPIGNLDLKTLDALDVSY